MGGQRDIHASIFCYWWGKRQLTLSLLRNWRQW